MTVPGTTYTVRRWSGLLALGAEAGLVLALGVVLGILQDRMAVNLVTAVVVLVLAGRAFDRATLALRVDASGITWASPSPRVLISASGVRRLDWGSVHDVEVVEGRLLRARLDADAPLPGWMSGRVVDPSDPSRLTVVEGEAPGVEGALVREVMNRVAPDVLVRVQGGTAASGGAESGR